MGEGHHPSPLLSSHKGNNVGKRGGWGDIDDFFPCFSMIEGGRQ
jgi:hypothetical protein